MGRTNDPLGAFHVRRLVQWKVLILWLPQKRLYWF